MMYVVVYLSAKLGRVYGKGLFAVIRNLYPRWLLYPMMIGAIVGNLIEAAANMGGIGASLNLLIPIPVPLIIVGAALEILGLQVWVPTPCRVTFSNGCHWRCSPMSVLRSSRNPISARFSGNVHTPHPVQWRVSLDDRRAHRHVAIGLHLYLASNPIRRWRSRSKKEGAPVEQRRGATDRELARTRREVLIGMAFSNLILFIILASGATLHSSGKVEIETAAEAAGALEPLAGQGAKILFAMGVVGVGILAVPVMTTGAVYDLAQALGKPSSLNAKPHEAPLFYVTIAIVTGLAVLLNLVGLNPMKALVWSGIVQGFSVPPLLLLMMLMTNDPEVMGDRVNGRLKSLGAICQWP
jgi:Mn2+/Fe2+ NRAMP family transporter